MAWNASNDAIIGWLSDTLPTARNARRNRLPAIRFGGLVWAAAFWLAWFPWGGLGASPALAGLNFAVNLCTYDAVLTLVEVNHHALLAEVSTDSRERAGYNSWSSVCAAMGSLTSLVGHHYWKEGGGGSLAGFRRFALVVALVSAAAFELSFRHLRAVKAFGKTHDRAKGGGQTGHKLRRIGATHLSTPSSSPPPPTPTPPTPLGPPTKPRRARAGQGRVAGFVAFARGLARQRNFVVFAGVSFLQTFDCAFGKNFFAVFLELLAGDAVPCRTQALLIAASFLAPWLAAAWLSRAIERGRATLSSTLDSVWRARVILLAPLAALVLGAAACGGGGGTAGASGAVDPSTGSGMDALWRSAWVRRCAALVLLANRVISECVCRLVPLVEGDLIDEHRFLLMSETAQHQPPPPVTTVATQTGSSEDVAQLPPQPQHSMSASLVGTANLISKPSQSLGPMVGLALLSVLVPRPLAPSGGDAHIRGGAWRVDRGLDKATSPPPVRGWGDGSDGMLSQQSPSIDITTGQRNAVACIVVVLPLSCVFLQRLLWNRFTLRGKYLAAIKGFLEERDSDSAV